MELICEINYPKYDDHLPNKRRLLSDDDQDKSMNFIIYEFHHQLNESESQIDEIFKPEKLFWVPIKIWL